MALFPVRGEGLAQRPEGKARGAFWENERVSFDFPAGGEVFLLHIFKQCGNIESDPAEHKYDRRNAL